MTLKYVDKYCICWTVLDEMIGSNNQPIYYMKPYRIPHKQKYCENVDLKMAAYVPVNDIDDFLERLTPEKWRLLQEE